MHKVKRVDLGRLIREQEGGLWRQIAACYMAPNNLDESTLPLPLSLSSTAHWASSSPSVGLTGFFKK